MERIAAALWGLCAAQTVPLVTGPEAPDAAGMTLCMAESICIRNTIDPEDMRTRLQNRRNGKNTEGVYPESFDAVLRYGSSADRMFPVAMYLYLKYGEDLLLYQGALNDIAAVSAITHKSPDAVAESQLYCGILAKLLAGRTLSEAISWSVYILRAYYCHSRDYGGIHKVLTSISTEEDVHLQYVQLDDSGTFRTTLDWASFLLVRCGSYSQCVVGAAAAPVPQPRLLSAAVGTLAALRDGFDSIPVEWMEKVPDKNRVAQCCDGLYRYWLSIVQRNGIGYGCKEDSTWKPRIQSVKTLKGIP